MNSKQEHARQGRVRQSRRYEELYADYQLLLDAVDQCSCTPEDKKLLFRAVDDYFRRDEHYALLAKYKFRPPIIRAGPPPTSKETAELEEMVENHGH